MALYSKPNLLNVVWSSGGDKIAPDAAKYNTGWLAEIPPRQYFNFIDWKQDQFAAYINQLGIPEWDNETEYQANKSVVQGSNGVIYQALVTTTNVNPITDTSSRWRRIAVEDAPANGLQYIRRNNEWQQIDSTAFAPAVHTHTIAQVTGLQNALNNKLDITGQIPTLNSVTSIQLELSSAANTDNFVRGKVGDVNSWYVGKGGSSTNDIQLSSYLHGTTLSLLTDRISSNKELYVGANRVWHEGNFSPSNYAPVNHTHTIAQISSLQTTLNAKLNAASPTATSGNFTISNGVMVIRQATPYVTGQTVAGTSNWIVGRQGANTIFHDYVHNTQVALTSSNISLNRALSVSGTITASNNITAYSDKRIKNIEKPLGSVSDILKNIGSYYYFHNENAPEGSDKENRQLGVIAQEVQEYFPELITTNSNGLLSVDYGRLSVVLLEGLKEALARIEKLEANNGTTSTS